MVMAFEKTIRLKYDIDLVIKVYFHVYLGLEKM